MRKFIRLFIALTLIMGAATFVLPGSGSALTNKEITKCVRDYDGDRYPFEKTQHTQFKKNKCSDNKGGNCTDIRDEDNIRFVEITCDDGKIPAPDCEGDGFCDPAASADARCTDDDCDIITNYINPFIKLLTVVVGIAVVIGIIIGAIQVITSTADPQQTAKGKDHIRDAIIALVAYTVLFAFLQFIIPGGIV